MIPLLTPPPPHSQRVLLPRTKGFVLTMQMLGDHVDVVYDLTLAFPDGKPSFGDWVAGNKYRIDAFIRFGGGAGGGQSTSRLS